MTPGLSDTCAIMFCNLVLCFLDHVQVRERKEGERTVNRDGRGGKNRKRKEPDKEVKQEEKKNIKHHLF